MRIVEVKNWKTVALDRDERAKLLRKARAHQRLSPPMMMILCNGLLARCESSESSFHG
jgi:hypothetical protein